MTNTLSPKFQKFVRAPILIALFGLAIAFVILFVWSVNTKIDSSVKAGAITLYFLSETESVEKEVCDLDENASGGAVILTKKNGEKFNLLEWVGRERVSGEDSLLRKILKAQKLSFDQIPVASCRLWPKILEYSKSLQGSDLSY